jgi:hypothetical protein
MTRYLAKTASRAMPKASFACSGGVSARRTAGVLARTTRPKLPKVVASRPAESKLRPGEGPRNRPNSYSHRSWTFASNGGNLGIDVGFYR